MNKNLKAPKVYREGQKKLKKEIFLKKKIKKKVKPKKKKKKKPKGD